MSARRTSNAHGVPQAAEHAKKELEELRASMTPQAHVVNRAECETQEWEEWLACAETASAQARQRRRRRSGRREKAPTPR